MNYQVSLKIVYLFFLRVLWYVFYGRKFRNFNELGSIKKEYYKKVLLNFVKQDSGRLSKVQVRIDLRIFFEYYYIVLEGEGGYNLFEDQIFSIY